MNSLPSTLVVGFGNPYMGDEGIGVHLVQRVAEVCAERADIECLDGGTAGLAVLHQLKGRDRGIFIDCAFMVQPPGTMVQIDPRRAKSRKTEQGWSLHHGDPLQLIELAERLGECPPTMIVFGIQPASIAPGEGLSPVLQTQSEMYVQAVLAVL